MKAFSENNLGIIYGYINDLTRNKASLDMRIEQNRRGYAKSRCPDLGPMKL